jgi:hemerythrin-like domain-containing protein
MSILSRLRSDHNGFRAELGRIQAEIVAVRDLSSDKERRETAARLAGSLLQLVQAVRKHEDVERRLLYPNLLAASPVPSADLDQLEKQHTLIGQTLERLIEGLRTAAKRPPSWLILSILQLSNMLRRHMAREEALVFPLALEHIGAVELERLGREAERLKDRAAARRERL